MEGLKRVFSGIQPSGKLTIGNYFGALQNWVALQNGHECIYSVVDLHAITQRHEPASLRRQILEVYAQLIACGIDAEKHTLYIQSHVPQHAELCWILGCYTMYGELSRMTQFKDKSAVHPENINSGLFTYPVLQAADILLFCADLVPVGQDQKQHLELSRDVAVRFNGIYGDVFTLPEPYIPKLGAKIMSLTEPDKKMSKSASNPGSFVLLLDSPDDIMRKFKRAVTDSEPEVRFSEHKPGVSNLLSIFSAASGRSIPELEESFAGRGYGEFKPAVAEAVIERLRPIREKTEDLLKNRDYLEDLYRKNAVRASAVAARTLAKVQKKIGFVR